MATLTMEIGKLMAQVDGFQKQLAVIQKEICSAKNQITDVHNELLNFMAIVQKKSECQTIHEKLEKNYVLHSEIAPIKACLGMIALATITAVSAAFFNLILK